MKSIHQPSGWSVI